ncbi:ExbD/TolR family protein [Methylibium rhizosphaerae]|jgi:biopolymer transport protein ExbD|uniref:ExbD/TolR family protein n=1 Tax=Methylibium rhizosphaerae TaxID=2570323 RepID=UPI00112BA7DB|nr:biopolymer transporter ExbD [Methylibium rhizosphaerae]
MRVRRLRKQVAELEVTAFINLIVVLVPFLLSTAVFTRLAVMDLSLPAQSSGGAEQLKENNLKLEVVIRPDAIEVGDRIGGLIERVPNNDKGYDLKTLSSIIQMLKGKFPNQTDATVLAQPNTSYDVLVQVMDTVRESHVVQGPKVTRTELFPDISIGDAPISQGGKP